MRRLALLLPLAAALALAMPARGDDGREKGPDLRSLALELQSRLGSQAVELRQGTATVEIEPAGSRVAAPVPELRSEIHVASLIDAMNDARRAHGLPELRIDERLGRAAADRAGEMLARGFFAHVTPEGRDPFVPVLERGYDFTAAGENLANGFESARLVVRAWLDSPGHRDNILSPEFRDVGVAIAAADDRGHMFVALFGAE